MDFFDVVIWVTPLDPPKLTPWTPLETGPLAIPASDLCILNDLKDCNLN